MKRKVKTYPLTLLGFVLILSMSSIEVLYSQSYQIEIFVENVGNSGYSTEGRGVSRYRFYNGSTNLHPANKCVHSSANGTFNVNLLLKSFTVTGNTFVLSITSHNERKEESDDCGAQDVSDGTFRKPDIHEVTVNQTIKVSDFATGEFVSHERITLTDEGSTAWVDLKIRYSVPTPTKPTSSKTGNICGNDILNLNSAITLPKETPLSYEWEYRINNSYRPYYNPNYISCMETCKTNYPISGQLRGECESNCIEAYPISSVEDWKPFATTSSPSISNVIGDNIIPGGVKTSTTIHFRVKALGKEISSGYSQPLTLNFVPSSPTVDKSKIITAKACKDKANGSVSITGVASISPGYRWILRNGNDASPCNPTISGSCLTGSSGVESSPDFEIDSLKSGTYTLILANQGDNVGVCSKAYQFTIEEYAPIKVAADIARSVSCYNRSDGQISFSNTGGDGNPSFEIKRLSDGHTYPFAAAGTATDLSPGQYQVTARDICGSSITTLTLDNPTTVKGKITAEPSPCQDPGQGKLSVTASLGSGSYNYHLYENPDSPTLVRELLNGGPTDFSSNTLKAGKYQLSIRDGFRPSCSGFDTLFTINPPSPLAIENVKRGNIKCWNGNSGFISFEATGGVGKYVYLLTRIKDNETIENQTGLFEDLIAGEYTLTLKSGVEGCNDSFNHSDRITLTQPTAITITHSHKDVICNADTTGKILTTVTGGTGSYRYTWFTKLNGNWNAYKSGAKDIYGLRAGEYKMQVEDDLGCIIYSDPINVEEPSVVVVTEVVPKRYGCKGSEVNFVAKVSGGIPPYITEYSHEDGTYTTFDATTILGLGSYRVRATDAHGCTYLFPETLEIDDNALLITGTTTPNCYKSSNGTLVVKVEGGEEPYQYTIDNGLNFQSSPSFEGLVAGRYTVLARDNRGCENKISLEVAQKQDTPEINFLVSSRQNAFDILLITEISIPKPDSIRWTFDEAATIISDNTSAPKLKFSEEGDYSVSMTAYFEGCEYTMTKSLKLNPYDPDIIKTYSPGFRPIEKLLVSPNPNDGKFNLKVKLMKKQQLLLVIYDLKGFEVLRRKWEPLLELDEQISMEKVSTGAFVIRVVTDNDAREVKITVSK